ncbi:hypothetical protein [Rhodococcus sp. JVH1]|uniref:hypothetical protein n=1 Tax=Rhodococcus sp. JVH1 TaxID=745408 RepID=UPI0002FD0F61|nr:hypothetical protein [Rhodococcus sp. JVH1]
MAETQPRWNIDYYPDSDAAHVTPIDDLVGHSHDDDCACGAATEPVQRPDGTIGWVITHASLDGREHHEGDGHAAGT